MTTVHAPTKTALNTTWQTAPTQTINAGGVELAYRQLGPNSGVPLVFLTHLAAVLDNWDPRVVDGIAAKHRVITFDNRGDRCLQRVNTGDHRADGEGRRRLHPCPRL
jgi:hypothetical protein